MRPIVCCSMSRLPCARESQLEARESSPCSTSAAIPRPAVSIQLWFCRYSSTHHASGMYAATFSASTPILFAIVA